MFHQGEHHRKPLLALKVNVQRLFQDPITKQRDLILCPFRKALLTIDTNVFQYLLHAYFDDCLSVMKQHKSQFPRASMHKLYDFIEKIREGQDLDDQILITHPAKCLLSTPDRFHYINYK